MSRSHISNSKAKGKTDDDVDNPPEEETNFACGTCEFETLDETKFVDHLRTEHKPYLSSWCKCGKYFSTTTLLISHIKERSCVKEEMIYRCAAKDCKFETPVGVTFVQHVKNCHNENTFIFCVHCEKMFTLPHCLILHMQDECPQKHKNRKNPNESTEPTTTSITSTSSEKGLSASAKSKVPPVPKPAKKKGKELSTSANSKVPPVPRPAKKKRPIKESNTGTRKSKRLLKE